MREFAKKYPMFVLFLVSYTAVHLVFEYNFWWNEGDAIFGKYETAKGEGALSVAARVYYAKSVWMFVLVWLLALRHDFRAALTYSFSLYSVGLLLLFPVQAYSVLNVALAAGLLIELILKPPLLSERTSTQSLRATRSRARDRNVGGA
ncbi:MAG: hypothetical protein WBG86_19600 [Polyangiales bacterium]